MLLRSISLKILKLNHLMGIICNKWPLDGSHKTFDESVAWRAGTL